MHHLHNVSQDDPPITINKMTQTLTALIKPSTPSDNTMDLIYGNAKNWAVTTVLILRDHYSEVMENEINSLFALSNPSWEQPFETAANWARRNLGRRLLPETVERAEALLIARQADKSTDSSLSRASQQVPDDQIETASQTDAPQPPSPLPLPPAGTQVVVSAQVHSRPTVLPMREQKHLPDPVSQSAKQPRKQTVATMTDTVGDWSFSSQSEHEDSCPPPLSPLPPPPPEPTGTLQVPPKEQRSRRIPPIKSIRGESTSPSQPTLFSPRRTRPPQTTENNPPPAISTPPGVGPYTTITLRSAAPQLIPNPRPLMSTILELDDDDLSSLGEEEYRETYCNTGTTVASLRKNTVQSQIDFSRANTFATHTNTPIPPQTPTRRPIRHVNTTQKIKNWSLAVKEKWLILGDSNVARFPPFKIPNLQIDSFPGATFRHVKGVLSKIDPVSTVEIVVLSLGLNNRNQMAQTSFKELQRLLSVTKLKFPQAEIWLPLISFSRSLPQREQIHLHALNKYIKSHHQFIPELSRSQFSVERDGIHWTHATATRLLEHWAQLVN